MTLPPGIAERIDGRKVIVSISGGKDSTATALHLREMGIEASYLHMDTGWEAQETVDYVPRRRRIARADRSRAMTPAGVAALQARIARLEGENRRLRRMLAKAEG